MTPPTQQRLPASTLPTPPLLARSLGVMAYDEALALQRETHAAVMEGKEPPTLLLLEHTPVITVSRRKAAPQHVIASADRLRAMGIAVHETDRGGDVTYHGPGQLVGYPIVPLRPSEPRDPRSPRACTDGAAPALNPGQLQGMGIGCYMRTLEHAIIDTVATLGVEAHRREKLTGVWVTVSGQPHKLAALGVRVKRNVTMHGLALNIHSDLSHFDTIVPCGLPDADRRVANLVDLLQDDMKARFNKPGDLMATVRQRLAERLATLLGMDLTWADQAATNLAGL